MNQSRHDYDACTLNILRDVPDRQPVRSYTLSFGKPTRLVFGMGHTILSMLEEEKQRRHQVESILRKEEQVKGDVPSTKDAATEALRVMKKANPSLRDIFSNVVSIDDGDNRQSKRSS